MPIHAAFCVAAKSAYASTTRPSGRLEAIASTTRTTDSISGGARGSAQFVDLVVQNPAGNHALGHPLDPVEPLVALIAGLEPRSRVDRRTVDAGGEVDPAAVREVDD